MIYCLNNFSIALDLTLEPCDTMTSGQTIILALNSGKGVEREDKSIISSFAKGLLII